MAHKLGAKRWGCCDAAVEADYTGILDYALTANGQVMFARMCPNGHVRTQFVPL